MQSLVNLWPKCPSGRKGPGSTHAGGTALHHDSVGPGGLSQTLHCISELVTQGMWALDTGHCAPWHPQVWELVGMPGVHWIKGIRRSHTWVTSQAAGLP